MNKEANENVGKKNQEPPKPKGKRIRQRAFLNEARESGMAAIQVDFNTDYRWSTAKNDWHVYNHGSIDISDCRKTISLDFYKNKKQALAKLDVMIKILNKCRDFVNENFGDK